MNRQQQSQAYKLYCSALQAQSGLTGVALQEHIRETVRQSYKVLFNSETIRQRDMNSEQLEQLAQHRLAMVNLMATV